MPSKQEISWLRKTLGFIWYHGKSLDASSNRTRCRLLAHAYERKNPARDAPRELGQFFTPPTLTNLIAQMVDPKETQDGEWILEPAAGFGGMMFSDWQKFGGMDKPIGSRYYAAAELSQEQPEPVGLEWSYSRWLVMWTA